MVNRYIAWAVDNSVDEVLVLQKISSRYDAYCIMIITVRSLLDLLNDLEKGKIDEAHINTIHLFDSEKECITACSIIDSNRKFYCQKVNVYG